MPPMRSLMRSSTPFGETILRVLSMMRVTSSREIIRGAVLDDAAGACVDDASRTITPRTTVTTQKNAVRNVLIETPRWKHVENQEATRKRLRCSDVRIHEARSHAPRRHDRRHRRRVQCRAKHGQLAQRPQHRSEEHTSELQSIMRNSYAV